MKEAINTTAVPAAIGVYSQAVRVNNTIYCSGQIGLDPDTMQLVSSTFAAEATQTFQNFSNLILASGATTEHVVKLTIYLTEMENFQAVNEVMRQYFQEPYPARACVAVKELPKKARVEIDAILELG